MNLYHLSRDAGEVDYDEYDAFIIAAHSEEEARNFAFEHVWNDEAIMWVDSLRVSCVVIGSACPDVHAGIILGSFNAG